MKFDHEKAERQHLDDIEHRQRQLLVEAEKLRACLSDPAADDAPARRQALRELKTLAWLGTEILKFDTVRLRVRRQLAELTGKLRADADQDREVSITIHHGPPDPGDRPVAGYDRGVLDPED